MRTIFCDYCGGKIDDEAGAFKEMRYIDKTAYNIDVCKDCRKAQNSELETDRGLRIAEQSELNRKQEERRGRIVEKWQNLWLARRESRMS